MNRKISNTGTLASNIEPPTIPFFGCTVPSLVGANLAVLGIPYDYSSSYRKGSALAPSSIRENTSAELYNVYTEESINLEENCKIFDCGDISFTSEKVEEAKNLVFQSISPLANNLNHFLFLGGDHLATYFSFSVLKQLDKFRNKKMGLIYMDSHPDLYDQYNGNRYSHACVVRRIIEETDLNPKNIVQMGIRATTPEQIEFCDQSGILSITTKDIQESEAKTVVSNVSDHLKDKVDYIYLSIDLDVLDPAFAPGIGNPEPGGLSTTQVVRLIQEFRNLPLGSFDIVELNPKYDQSRLAAFASAKIIKETLGVLNFDI
jgi:agmatinase